MIKANELRIGNWVLAYGVEILIFSIAPKANGSKYGFNLVEGEMLSFYDHECEPIPLTPEILERCGFIIEKDWHSTSIGDKVVYHYLPCYQQGNSDRVYGSEISLCLENNKIYMINDVFEDRDYSEIKGEVNSLHQLQNLYHALTGEELATPTPPTSQ